MDPADFYGIRGASFTALRRELGWLSEAPHPEEDRLTRAIGAGLLHGDDPDRLRALAAALIAPAPPELQALGPSLFHWESQSITTAASATGQRYIHHETRGSRVLLFVREQPWQGTVTEPFVCLGFARYESHEGERPMAVRWRLEGEIPAAWLQVMGLAV